MIQLLATVGYGDEIRVKIGDVQTTGIVDSQHGTWLHITTKNPIPVNRYRVWCLWPHRFPHCTKIRMRTDAWVSAEGAVEHLALTRSIWDIVECPYDREIMEDNTWNFGQTVSFRHDNEHHYGILVRSGRNFLDERGQKVTVHVLKSEKDGKLYYKKHRDTRTHPQPSRY